MLIDTTMLKHASNNVRKQKHNSIASSCKETDKVNWYQWANTNFHDQLQAQQEKIKLKRDEDRI